MQRSCGIDKLGTYSPTSRTKIADLLARPVSQGQLVTAPNRQHACFRCLLRLDKFRGATPDMHS